MQTKSISSRPSAVTRQAPCAALTKKGRAADGAKGADGRVHAAGGSREVRRSNSCSEVMDLADVFLHDRDAGGDAEGEGVILSLLGRPVLRL